MLEVLFKVVPGDLRKRDRSVLGGKVFGTKTLVILRNLGCFDASQPSQCSSFTQLLANSTRGSVGLETPVLGFSEADLQSRHDSSISGQVSSV